MAQRQDQPVLALQPIDRARAHQRSVAAGAEDAAILVGGATLVGLDGGEHLGIGGTLLAAREPAAARPR